MSNETLKKKKKNWNSSSSFNVKLDWFKIELCQMKLEKKKKFVELEFHSKNLSSFFFFFFFFLLNLIVPYSIFYKLSFTLKLDFEKIEFQNKDMNLNNFKTVTYC